jgi:hypothetical protein
MTPSMHLNAIVASFSSLPDAEAIKTALYRAYALGHEFGLERAGTYYNAIGAAKRIRTLKVVEVLPVETIEKSFL